MDKLICQKNICLFNSSVDRDEKNVYWLYLGYKVE